MCSRFTRVNLLHIGILDVGRSNVTRKRPNAGAFLQGGMDPMRSSRSAALPVIRGLLLVSQCNHWVYPGRFSCWYIA
jgi:hypothetical protein